MWNALLEAGAEFGIRPCGLGARNTLRLEAGMSLYGHEISEEINVLEAGLNRWLKLDKGDFIGRDACRRSRPAAARSARSSAWKWSNAASPATGTRCFHSRGEQIGRVTSGSPAPFLKTNIAMALVPASVAASGSDVLVDVPRQQGPRQAGTNPLLQAPEEVKERGGAPDLTRRSHRLCRSCALIQSENGGNDIAD